MIAIIGTSDRPCWLAEACKILLLLLHARLECCIDQSCSKRWNLIKSCTVMTCKPSCSLSAEKPSAAEFTIVWSVVTSTHQVPECTVSRALQKRAHPTIQLNAFQGCSPSFSTQSQHTGCLLVCRLTWCYQVTCTTTSAHAQSSRTHACQLQLMVLIRPLCG